MKNNYLFQIIDSCTAFFVDSARYSMRIKLFVLPCLLFSSVVFAEGELSQIEKKKVEYIFRLTKYVIWPKSFFIGKTEPIRICVSSEHSFEDYMREKLISKKSKGRSIDVVPYTDNNQICHMTYVKGKRNPSIKKRSTVLISDEHGRKVGRSSIVLYHSKGKVKIEVILYNLERTGARLSSELLKIAKVKR